MKDIISVCGLKCSECSCYQATLQDDDKKRDEVAVEWSKAYGASLKTEDINCDGCNMGSNRVFAHCKECNMRLCAISRNYETCAECTDYPCTQLDELHKMVPSARDNLDVLRDIILK